MKFGGTSVASAERIQHVARLITNDDSPKIVVLSAMAGTTNMLVEISRQLMQKHRHEALMLLAKLKRKYEIETQLLFTDRVSYDKNWTIVNETFFFLEQICYAEHFTLFDEKKILARGELLSTAMMLGHLANLGIKAVGLPALEFMRTDKNAEPDLPYITEHLEAILSRIEPDVNLFITEGYICRNAFGDIDNLQRGGSDYTASLIGAALSSKEIQIWTDIDGIHNNDPRVVDKTSPIRRLRFEEAAELAYFGAKILHPTCIQPARVKGIPVRLLNTLDPSAEGTIISTETDKDQIKAVAAKDNVSILRIRSNYQLSPWNYIAQVFAIFEREHIVVDMISATEVALSFAFESEKINDALLDELSSLGDIEVLNDLVAICVVGDMESENIGFQTKVLESLNAIPLMMITYGGSDYNLSIVTHKDYKQETLSILNNQLFNKA